MTRRHLLFLVCALAASVSLASPPAVHAQDKDKGGQKKDKEKDPKDTAEWKECERIGASFRAKDSAALVGCMRKKGKLKIKLGGTDGDFDKEQAQQNLDTWFDGKSDLEVEMKSLSDLTGTLDLKFRTTGKDRKLSRKLVVTLEKKDKGEGFFLTKLETVE